MHPAFYIRENYFKPHIKNVEKWDDLNYYQFLQLNVLYYVTPV